METKGEQCSARVAHDNWGHYHQCEKRTVVERDGKPYCKIHDPEYIKEKDRIREEKWEKEWGEKETRRAEQRRYDELAKVAVEACRKLNPDNPLAVAESISDLYEALKALVINEGQCGIPKGQSIIRAEKALAKAEGK